MATEDSKDFRGDLTPFKKPKRRRVVELTQYPNDDDVEQLSVAEPYRNYSASFLDEKFHDEEVVAVIFKTIIVERLVKNEHLVEQIKNNSDDRVQQGMYSELLERAIIESLGDHKETVMKLLVESNIAKQFSIAVFTEIKNRVLSSLDEGKVMTEGKAKNEI